MAATIEIPARYLTDARQALAVELTLSAECLRDGDEQDRASNVDIIERDTRLLSQLSASDDDMTVSAERDNVSSPIEHMLDQIIRVVAARLDEQKQYGPVPMGAILDIAEELRWAASEATRIWPGADERKGA
jgi:hypothetical protein